MPRHVVLLRNLNNVGMNRVAMADLRRWLAAAGFEDVETLGASGNVVVSAAERSAAKVQAAVADVMRARMGKEIGVLARTAAEMRTLVAAAPFRGEPAADERHAVVFVQDRLDAPPVLRGATATLSPSRREFYAVLRVVDGRLAYPTARIGPLAAATTRWWSVVRKLAERLDG